MVMPKSEFVSRSIVVDEDDVKVNKSSNVLDAHVKNYDNYLEEDERNRKKMLIAMNAQKEIANSKGGYSGHGYSSAYIPTGTMKPVGQHNLSHYLATHKKLFDHKHTRSLQIGLSPGF